MSELLNSSKERVDALYNMFSGFIEKKDGRELWDAYKHKLDALTPVDVLLMGDKPLEADIPHSRSQIMLKKYLM